MENLGRIKCVVDVGDNSIEIDPYVADFFFEPVFLSGMYPDISCTAQILEFDGEKSPPLTKVEIISKRRGQRYDALRITSEELFSKPRKFRIIFGFDSERLQQPLQLEAEVEVRSSGSPIVARILSGLPESYHGSVSADLSGVNQTVRSQKSMTFWDWPHEDTILEIKADNGWISEFGEIEVLHHDGKEGLAEFSKLGNEFKRIDFSAINPLVMPKGGFPHAPYHSCAYIILRMQDGSEIPVVSHLVDTRKSRKRHFGKISDLDDLDGWPHFLWKGTHFKEQPKGEKFLIKKGRLWEGFSYHDSEIPDTIKRVQHDRYTSVVPTRAWFEYKDEEFIVNWFHLDEYGWNIYFEDNPEDDHQS